MWLFILKLLFFFLVSCALGWVFFVITTQLVIIILRRLMGISIGYRMVQLNCIKDVTIIFKKGMIEYISIGEMKLDFTNFIMKLGTGDPKIELLISDLSVILRPKSPNQSSKKKIKNPSKKSSSSGGQKEKILLILAKFASFWSISIFDITLKDPKAVVGVREFKIDLHKCEESDKFFRFQIQILPILFQITNPDLVLDHPIRFSQVDQLINGQTCSNSVQCDEFSVNCEFGRSKGNKGIKIRDLDVKCGNISVKSNESLLAEKNQSDNVGPTGSENSLKSDEIKSDKNKSNSSQSKLSSLKKKLISFPDKVSFNIPKIDVRFAHQVHSIFIHNNITGVSLTGQKSTLRDESAQEDLTRIGLNLDFNEIHILKDDTNSVLEILKVAASASLDIRNQELAPIRAETDMKFGGTKCNLMVHKLVPLLSLKPAKKPKPLVLSEKENNNKNISVKEIIEPKPKLIMWSFTGSAPELTMVLFTTENSPLLHVCSQSTHIFANNFAKNGAEIYSELAELNINMSGEFQHTIKEKYFKIKTDKSSLLHIAKIRADIGKKETDSDESVTSLDISQMDINLCFQHLERILFTISSFKSLIMKTLSSTKKLAQNKSSSKNNSGKKGVKKIMKLSLDTCLIKYFDEMSIQDMIVQDPKRVNYGSQGGRVLITTCNDGVPRVATIFTTQPSNCDKIKFCTSFEILNLNLCMNKEKRTTQVELERARSKYKELLEGKKEKEESKLTLFDMKNAKFVRRSNDKDSCSLLNVTDISIKWKPDPHLALFESFMKVKSVMYKIKIQNLDSEIPQDQESGKTEIPEKEIPKKKDSVFAIDIEKLKLAAELADGVEAVINVQTIFSENAKIGVLLEGLELGFNGARVFRTSRIQVSRIPVSVTCHVTTLDWVVQARDVNICLPYRLEIRAIDDAVEDTIRCLKLLSSAKSDLVFPEKKTIVKKVKPVKNRSTKIRYVRFMIKELVGEIEEEPIQGWLDEHYHLLKNEICEATNRLNQLDESSSKEDNSNNNSSDGSSKLTNEKAREEIYKRTFSSYYNACRKLPSSNGSGSCPNGSFQSGFKFSENRKSVFSIKLKDVDLSLSAIEGGEEGMIRFIKSVDLYCEKNEVPFGKFYGCNLNLTAGSLIVQIRDYTFPLLAATAGKCDGCIVLAQQATYFQPQILQDVFVGKYWKVRLFRSASGTTPPVKFYSNLPIHFQKGELSFGVGYEPVFADISYAFSVALRRAVLGQKTSPLNEPPPRKEKSLPWWDDMRNYIHGINSLYFNETHWHLLASIDPYEKNEKIDFLTSYLEVQQRDGRVSVEAKNIEAHLSSLYTLVKNNRLNIPSRKVVPFIKSPSLFFEIDMEWQCESREPTNHFLHAFPNEGKTREKILDPFRSTSLSLKWGFSLKPLFESNDVNTPTEFPTFNMAAHDLAWLIKWWNMVYLPPQKLRMFSRWPRFKVPRIVRSGNLPLDKVMTENFIRFESTPTCINYITLRDDDSAHGLSFRTAKLKYEMCFGRGKYEQYSFDSKRETMDLVYQALDLHSLKGNINTNNEKHEKYKDEGFLLYSEYITIRRQAPKADPIRLLMWREAAKSRNNNDLNDRIKSEFDNECDDDREPSDLSDDDGFNVVVADNCQRIYVYGLRILWNLENRNAVFSWVGAMSKAFEPAKPSPSRVYAQRKLSERREKEKEGETGRENDPVDGDDVAAPHSPDRGESNGEFSKSSKVDVPSGFSPVGKGNNVEAEKEQETKHFIVNVIAPQFNLHSEEANGRFLLAAASGKVLLHSFHSILHVGYQLIAQALSNNTNNPSTTNTSTNPNNGNTNTTNNMTWSRSELVIMLEHVQAHVAPTDVDPGAGLQWLPKILKKSEVKRTGALLERVFTPCEMFFRYTRHKGGPELKVKPLKELTFNSPSIAASMTSRQFQVMMDVLTNLLLARSPKPQNNYLTYPSEEEGEDNEDSREEESDEVVPDGIEEVELAKIKLEKRDRETKILIDDIRTLSSLPAADVAAESALKSDDSSNTGTIVLCSRPSLIQGLKKELEIARKLKKEAISELRETIGKVVQVKLIEKEKNKSPSYAMRISMKIEKVVWSMLIDGKSFAETEINDMVYDFDRDFRDKGVSNFTTKSVVIKNCLQNAKSNTLLSAWNPPPEWGKNVMVRINSKQGAPKDGSSPIESFLVDIYPLKIHLTESMYRMMWEYFFPDEEQHSHKRQEVWKVSTIAGTRKVKKTVSAQDSSETSSHFSYESSARGDSSHGGKSQKGGLNLWGSNSNSSTKSELRRTSSFDQATWEETIADSVANEIVKQATNQKSSQNISKNENLGLSIEQIQDAELAKSKSKDSKRGSQSGRAPRDDSKKVVKPRKLTEFQSFKISQVELLLTYEGSLAVKDLRLLMDTFHRENFTGTWTRLFGRVKKHIVLGVFKSVMGMQGKKFKDKSRFPTLSSQPSIPASLSLSSSSDDDLISTFLRKQSSDQGAGEGFVTAIKGLFGSQRKKAKKLVLRTMRGDGDEGGDLRGKMSDGEAEFSPFARQLTITKARKLIRQHTKKLTSRNTRKDHSGGNQDGDEREAPRESVGYDGDFDFDEDEMPFDEN